ncbi:uncharacterized protein LY79DRAFT_332465 [Colletotrichum navitas]|uniref:Uncharacterized protein n=1 Tax=Colletotrichum navitas TaxID=681940 RepID=A0AAD8PTS1_9PEZI|nr:uncharacterized protein LY79DRAFT_332465 [Colletotrichum navitas]KAK1579883.1 hypothetical protein LY79DRAFT_332465 [Colletotrichum navitas]
MVGACSTNRSLQRLPRSFAFLLAFRPTPKGSFIHHTCFSVCCHSRHTSTTLRYTTPHHTTLRLVAWAASLRFALPEIRLPIRGVVTGNIRCLRRLFLAHFGIFNSWGSFAAEVPDCNSTSPCRFAIEAGVAPSWTSLPSFFLDADCRHLECTGRIRGTGSDLTCILSVTVRSNTSSPQ